jgi:uncharacterized glyoxalase superfamily protein PhnB
MLGSEKLMAFVATRDAARAKAFYAGALGLHLVTDDEWALVFDAAGTTLRIQKVQELAPAAYTALGWQVPEITGAISALRDKGVVFERYAFLEQDEAGVWAAPGGAKVAWFKDPDGNVLSLTESSVSERQRIVPEIFVHDGLGALSFYQRAFGAQEHSRMLTPDGKKLVHGELSIAGHRLFVCDEFSASEGGTCKAPRTLGGTGVRINLEVDDADRTVARAVAAGATVMLAVQDTFWGARYGKLRDPYGHEWGINQQVKHLSASEEAEEGKRFFAKREA